MPSRLGIVAGGGELPARLIAACRAEGRDFFVLALEGHADPAMIGDAPHAWIRLGAAGRGLDILRRAGVDELVMAGPVRRPSLAELRPDIRTARFFARIGLKALGDDGLLRAVVAELQSEGFRVIGVDEVLADIVARPGVYGRVSPDEQAQADIRRGFEVAKALGAVDVGQAAVVQQGIVLGVEAVEGTAELIRRCAALRREGPGGVLVKVAKPGQERRVDLPAIGIETIRQAVDAGLRGIAVEAGAALVIGEAAMVAEADACGVFICGLRDGRVGEAGG